MLRATARVLVPCDGRPLGRILGNLAPPGAAERTQAPAGEEISVRLPGEGGEPRIVVTPRRGVPIRRRSAPAVAAAAASDVVPAAGGDRGDGAGGATAIAALEFDNGIGGLTADGSYQIRCSGDRLPPAPWVNVVANARGGFVVSESGGGFTWAGSSYSYRLTPWHNDPVSDPASEVIYLRDDDSGELWSATPAPIRQDVPFTIHHGAGFSSFEHERRGIGVRLTLGLADEDPVKIALVSVTNTSDRPRRLTVTSYVEWTLGVLREHTQHQVQTRFDGQLGTIFGGNFVRSRVQPDGWRSTR